MKIILALIFVCVIFRNAQGKIFTKCDLAKELKRLGIAVGELHKWAPKAFLKCPNIPYQETHAYEAEHTTTNYESSFNTVAIGDNGSSKDHGIFQINDYWNCDPGNKTNPKNGCGHLCSDYRNEDLSDDIVCINKLKREHGGWGFSYAYQSHCTSIRSSYLNGCGV